MDKRLHRRIAAVLTLVDNHARHSCRSTDFYGTIAESGKKRQCSETHCPLIARMQICEPESARLKSLHIGDGENEMEAEEEGNINAVLTDDALQAVLSKLKVPYDRDACALVCKRWKAIYDRGRRSMRLRAGPLMLERVAARFSHLTNLDMSENAGRSFYPGWKDADLTLVARSFHHLECLYLTNCKGITDKGLAEIGLNLPKLQFLDLTDCKQVTDTGIEKIATGCRDLRTLYLNRCKLITDKAVGALSQCRFLESLALQGCNKVGDDGLRKLSEGCSVLEVLDVSKCGQVGDAGVKSIVQASSATLRALMLEDCPQVGDAGVIAAGECCQSLEILLLGGCRLLSDLALDAHFRRHTNLITLQVEYCLKLSDAGIMSIFSNCSLLAVLDIRCCSMLTDKCFDTLTLAGNCLKELKISGCSGITSVGVQKVAESCPHLDFLEAKYCEHITTFHIVGLALPNGCKVVLDSQTFLF